MSLDRKKPELSRRSLSDKRNLVPHPYRGVSYQPYSGDMTESAITLHLIGKEAYRRTHFVVLHNDVYQHSIVAIDVVDREAFFSKIDHIEVLALPERCVFVKDASTDCANPSALADLAEKNGVSKEEALICEGMYDHINFIYQPDPIVIRVVEVAPPEPPKLMGLVKQVLSYASLPPIRPVLERIDLRTLCSSVHATNFLVPCRSGGLEDMGSPVHFLDERPAQRRDWTLIGCERSVQFHRHYFDDEPTRVEMCPHKIFTDREGLTILKCCLLEFDIQKEGDTVIVPWGSDLPMIERALRVLVNEENIQ